MTRFPQQPQPDPQGTETDESLPPRLVEGLSALYPTPHVPATVDAKVLNNAAATWARQARFRRWLRWGGAGAAAAAAVLMVVLILPDRTGSEKQDRYTLAGDVDGNGQVDILDAFSLARKVRDTKDKPVPVTRWEDVNGDGVIDNKDVDQIARMAVRVNDTPNP